MDHIRIIRRAFEIVWRYPVLWIFGFLLALTTSNNRGSNPFWNFGSGDFSPRGDFRLPERWPGDFPTIPFPYVPQAVLNSVIGVIAAVLCLGLLVWIIFIIVRYVALAASIRMVDRYESEGVKQGFVSGWRLGWSRAAFRVWLVDLLFGVGTFLVFLLLFLMAAGPLLLLLIRSDVIRAAGVFASIGLNILVILLLILVAAALSLLLQFIYRAVALENLGVFAAIRRGWNLVWHRLGDVVVMGLALFGIGLLFAIVLIPVSLILVVIGIVAGGLPALLAGGLTNIFVHGNMPQIVALAVGVPIFVLVMAIPLAFLGGLLEIYKSSAWTLTYREVLARENIQPAAA